MPDCAGIMFESGNCGTRFSIKLKLEGVPSILPPSLNPSRQGREEKEPDLSFAENRIVEFRN
jgi:hypothetical protein